MRKRLIILLGAIIAHGSAFAAPAPKSRFLLLTPFVNYEFFQPLRQGAEDAALALGVEVLFTGTTNGDVKALAKQAQDALAADYSGIGINMIDAEEFDAVALAAARKGVPLISFNVDDANTPNARVATVGQNMRLAGRAFGEALVPLIQPGSHALLTMHDPGITALEERAAGAQAALKHCRLEWTTLVTGTDREAAVAKVQEALASDPSIRVVLGTGEADTQAIGIAIEHQGKRRQYVAAGFDTGGEILRLVGAGILHLTVDQQPYAQGYFAITTLALANRRSGKPASVDTGATIIRTDRATSAESQIPALRQDVTKKSAREGCNG